MTPLEREKFDLEIYLKTKDPEFNGCFVDASDYLHRKDSSKISRQLNPADSRKDTLFGEAMDVLEALHYKHPELAKFIWKKMNLQWHEISREAQNHKSKLLNIVRQTSNEQLDVYDAIARELPETDLKREAYEAYLQSKAQYEQIAGVTIVEIFQ
ncbi:MAG TPA: hypothetical protein PKY82_23885 [Pyrinomonadaceae bacterium]|nr:hypothetical protein [Pyrinomonadaceae bacterium]